jgi:hypothetical protein
MPQSAHIRCGRTVAEHLQNRIARHKMNQQKNERHRQPDNWKRKGKAGQDLLHRSPSP